ncbi:MAG: T9SS type A sorting domain-containing protein [Bacteroidetes bacterium]|nr:T9SS type A sorting domain-containing protein [Bacteroidota bacterium]
MLFIRFKYFIICLFVAVLLPFYGTTQNLINNPSFEDTVSCPTNEFQLWRTDGWYAVNQTPDYFNSCTDNADIDVPVNYFGTTYPVDGNGYVGLVSYVSTTPDFREIIGTELKQPLVPGTRYYISACIIRSDTSIADCAVNKFGFKFSTTFMPSSPVVDNFSHFHSDSIFRDKNNWETIKGSFVADSAYSYLFIGNFYTDADITVSDCSTPGGYHFSYNFIDMICVSADSTKLNYSCNSTVGFTNEISANDYKISPNPFNDFLSVQTDYSSPVNFIISDLSGKVIVNQVIERSNTIETNHLTKGIYFYKIVDDAGKVKLGKLVKTD